MFELLPSSSRRNLSSRRANKALAKHVSVSGVVLQYADVETVGDSAVCRYSLLGVVRPRIDTLTALVFLVGPA